MMSTFLGSYNHAGKIYIDTPASFITCRGGDVPVFQMMSTFLATYYYILYVCISSL